MGSIARPSPFSAAVGALSRMLERGARSVSVIFRAIVFTFLPTALELAGGVGRGVRGGAGRWGGAWCKGWSWQVGWGVV